MSVAGGAPVVLGVGNLLLRDDGAGVRVVREMERLRDAGETVLPSGTELVDGGTLGPDVVAWIAGAGCLVVVDAVDLGAVPGTVAVLREEALARAAGGTSRSDGVGGILVAAGLAGLSLDAISVVGVQPGDVHAGPELTPPVRDALPALVAAVVEALRSMVPPGRRPVPVAGSPGTAEPEVRA